MFRALVVEDNAVVQFLLTRQLSGIAECDVAGDGFQALAFFRCALEDRKPYRAVLVDFQMPGITGLETVRRIREMEEGLPPEHDPTWIVMLTSFDDMKPTVLNDPIARVDAFLQKPHNVQELINALGRVAVMVS